MEKPGVRVSAANALAGMARISEIKQILNRMIPSDKLLALALADNPDRFEFRKSLDRLFICTGLGELPNGPIWDPDGGRKMKIVEQTQIKFEKKEMFQLMEQELRREGGPYADIADQLRKVANIQPIGKGCTTKECVHSIESIV